MFRKSRMAAFAVLVALALSGLAVAQDRWGWGDGDRDDDAYRRGGNSAQAHEYGRQNGYRDGYNKGIHEGRENDPFDYRTPDWRQAGHGYKNWMGSFGQYQDGYRDAYSQGFRAGFQSVQGLRRGDGDGDRDDRGYRPYDPRVGGGFFGGDVARDWGYRDGSDAARSDLRLGKGFNSQPRGRYDDADRGYNRSYGDKREYKERYTEAYRQGYATVWDSQGRGWRR